jgi:hypothetical protein
MPSKAEKKGKGEFPNGPPQVLHTKLNLPTSNLLNAN